jgi:hypothetical protein
MSQEGWQKIFEVVGRDAPRPLANEGSTAYERRMSTLAQKYVRRADDISRVNFDTLPKDALPQFVELLQASMVKNAHSSAGMKPGELRPVYEVDQHSGSKVRKWIGPESFVKDPIYGFQPCRRVTRICAPPMVDLYSAHNRRETSGLYG